MVSDITKYNYEKEIYTGIFLELIICFIVDVFIKSNLFMISIIGNIAFFLAIYIYLNDILLIACTLISSFTLIFLEYNMRLPHFISYIEDGLIMMMAIKLFIGYMKKRIRINNMYMFIILFICISICSYIVNPLSLSLYVKGLYYDYLRYFIVGVFTFYYSFSKEQIKKIAKILWYALLLQVPIIIYQCTHTSVYWTPKSQVVIKQDFYSGFLGWRSTTEFGLFAMISLTLLFILYMKSKISLKYLILASVVIIIGCIIAEVKFVFILIPIMFLYVVCTDISIKSMSVFVVTILMLIFGAFQIVKLYPEFDNFYNSKSVEKYSKDSYGSSGVGRTTSFLVANKMISTNLSNRLVGYGAGSANSLSDSYRFSQFSVAQYIVEDGYLGILCMYLWYVYIINISLKIVKYKKDEFENIIGHTGVIFASAIIFSTFLNDSMVKINFSVLSWMIMGGVYKYYYLHVKEFK